MKYLNLLIIFPLTLMLAACQSESSETTQQAAESSQESIDPSSIHIVFVTGDEEYRSEESMPMLARILKNRYGFQVSVRYALTDGYIDPNNQDNIEGLDVLVDADMMVMYTRFRSLPDEQLQYITDFAESGKPMAGFRTATHAFSYGENHENHHMDFEWPQEVFGLPWISHHGGSNSTDVLIDEENSDHPVLRGVEPFHARSWLYHANTLLDDAVPLLTGRAVEGAQPGGDYFDDPHTVAWTNYYEGEHGNSRVFFTTLGHPNDFFDENMRRLAIQGFFWALGMEDQIPDEGLNVDILGVYDPNPAGFGEQFKQNLRPDDIMLRVD
ncbi:MAG: ThuA domain-containing protein [Balneolaceae bacterium]|nr:ThuA domain-containing protein [Balneolaceae bacterium]